MNKQLEQDIIEMKLGQSGNKGKYRGIMWYVDTANGEHYLVLSEYNDYATFIQKYEIDDTTITIYLNSYIEAASTRNQQSLRCSHID